MARKALLLLCLLAGFRLSAQTIVQEFVSIGAPAQVIDLDLPKPSSKGNVIIAMPGPLTAGIKVLSITDNAPAGGNTYKLVPGSASSANNKTVEIWYCAPPCNPQVTELKFHLSALAQGSINTVLEVTNLAQSSVVDGDGGQVSDAKATDDGFEVGPSLTTSANDFVVARYSSANPLPKGVEPASWTYKTTHVYAKNAAPGAYQPKLTGAKAGSNFAMSMAAFKLADASATAPNSKAASEAGLGTRHFPF